MRQQKNINLVPGSFSNNRPYSPIQQQKSTLQRKNSALLSVRQSQGNPTYSQKNTNRLDSHQSNTNSNSNNNYPTYQKQSEQDNDDDGFQFLQENDRQLLSGRDQNLIMHQETFRTNNQAVNNQNHNHDQFLSNKSSGYYSTVKQSQQQRYVGQKESNANKENVNNSNSYQPLMKKNSSADNLTIKSKQKQYYSNAQSNISSNINQLAKEIPFRSEQQNQKNTFSNNNNNYSNHNTNNQQEGKLNSRSPSYRKIGINAASVVGKSQSPINSKRQILTDKSIQQSANTLKKSVKSVTNGINEKQESKNQNKSSNKSSIQTGSETPKVQGNKQQPSQFNLGYSPILKMEKGELINNQGCEEEAFDQDENSDVFNFNRYSEIMANNIVENILDKDDIYERTRQENKTYREMMKEQSQKIQKLEQQLKLSQIQQQELTQNMAVEKERYSSELVKFSEKIQRLKNIQTLYMEEKQNSENIEQNLNEKQKVIAAQQTKICQMVDWIFKTYSCLIVTKSTPNFEQDDLEYIWSQMTNLIRILSNDVIELELENSLKQLLKQPLKVVKEISKNSQRNTETQVISNSSRVSLSNSNNIKQNANNLNRQNHSHPSQQFQNKESISSWKDITTQNNHNNLYSEESNRGLPFFSTETDPSEKTLQRNYQGNSKNQQYPDFKSESFADDTFFQNHSFEKLGVNQNAKISIDEKEIEFIAEENENSQILTDIKIIQESEQTLKNCIKKDILQPLQNHEIKVERQLIFESELKEQPDVTKKDSSNIKQSQSESNSKEDCVIGVFDYVAQKEKDLSFKKGDIIQVIKRTKNGWWIGLLNKNIGYFPFNYVSEIKK